MSDSQDAHKHADSLVNDTSAAGIDIGGIGRLLLYMFRCRCRNNHARSGQLQCALPTCGS